MRRAPRPTAPDRPAGRRRRRRRLVVGLLAALAAPGCGGGAPRAKTASVAEPPTVLLARPAARTIVRTVEQPSFIQAYEHTDIYAKLASFVEKWNVDIGDKVKKGDVLATLFMPELVEEFRTKKADVALAKELIEHARKVEDAARADVEAAAAHLAETRAMLASYEASVVRWETQVERLTPEAKSGVVAPQILLEATNQFKESRAARDAAKATIKAAEADLLSKQADAAKAGVDVGVARARLVVAESEQKRLEALVGYLTLTAPYDGIIVARNANTGDFVTPATGDPSARSLSPYQSPDRAAPIYAVDRTDVVRIFVDIPERDSNYVRIGTKATVLVRAFRDKELPASVTRTSWAVNVKSRTLRAEVDLPNTDGQMLPGMYAYGKVVIDRPGVRALPLDALAYSGEQTYVWQLVDGKAVRTEVETGVTDGRWVEVTNRRLPAAPESAAGAAAWTPIDGSEQVILGDLSLLTDGSPVKVAAPPAEGKVANASPR